MDALGYILNGFDVALTPMNLLYCLLGVTIGTTIGVLPGLGPVATMSILLPLTYNISPVSAIIMLSGIYYGAMYGGSTTTILMKLPGEAASVVTALDGYEMTKQGRAGFALCIAAVGSFLAATIAIVCLSFFAPIVAKYALKIGPPEYATLMVMSLSLVAYLSTTSFIKSLTMAGVGLLLACVGTDPEWGVPRLAFGSVSLMSGIDFAVIAMGLFGVGEILSGFESKEGGKLLTDKITKIWPGLKELLTVKWSVLRGAVIGFFAGVLPGGGAVVASLLSYAVEKRCSDHPERFGRGAPEGVAAPESANNSAAVGAFIPLLTLGIPANVTMAVLFGALMIHGIVPGPFLIQEQPELFWGVINSMYIGNFVLLILNLPLIGVFVQLLRVRLSILAPIVILITMIGVYTINNRPFDIGIVLVFGILGYLMRKFGFDPGPLVLAYVLGPILETSFRQSLLISQGDMGIFIERPISVAFLLIAVFLVVTQIWKATVKKPVKASS